MTKISDINKAATLAATFDAMEASVPIRGEFYLDRLNHHKRVLTRIRILGPAKEVLIEGARKLHILNLVLRIKRVFLGEQR